MLLPPFYHTPHKYTAVEDIAREGRASSDEPENQEGKHFCEEHSKSIEVSYKHEKRGEPIHTAVSFPYHPHVRKL